MKRGSKPPAVMNQFAPWLESLRERGRSARTVQTYVTALTNCSRYLQRRGVRRLTAVSPRHLESWRLHLVDSGRKPACIELYLRVLRSAFCWLVQSGRLFENPAGGLIRSKVPRQMGPLLSEAEMNRVLNGIPPSDAIARRDRALLETAYATGARLEELVQLNLGSVDLDHGLVRLHGKGGRERLAPLTRTAATALEEYLAQGRPHLVQGSLEEPAVFLSRYGGRRLGSHGIEVAVRRWAKRAGLVLTPHAIRRAFATHLLRAGAGPAAIRELLGHRSYRHLDHYLRFCPAEMSASLQRQRPFRR